MNHPCRIWTGYVAFEENVAWLIVSVAAKIATNDREVQRYLVSSAYSLGPLHEDARERFACTRKVARVHAYIKIGLCSAELGFDDVPLFLPNFAPCTLKIGQNGVALRTPRFCYTFFFFFP